MTTNNTTVFAVILIVFAFLIYWISDYLSRARIRRITREYHSLMNDMGIDQMPIPYHHSYYPPRLHLSGRNYRPKQDSDTNSARFILLSTILFIGFIIYLVSVYGSEPNSNSGLLEATFEESPVNSSEISKNRAPFLSRDVIETPLNIKEPIYTGSETYGITDNKEEEIQPSFEKDSGFCIQAGSFDSYEQAKERCRILYSLGLSFFIQVVTLSGNTKYRVFAGWALQKEQLVPSCKLLKKNKVDFLIRDMRNITIDGEFYEQI